ncbi:MAG: HEAT repeat domain-containing protein [Planctomycetota bacterium]|jgi:hypothetical protein
MAPCSYRKTWRLTFILVLLAGGLLQPAARAGDGRNGLHLPKTKKASFNYLRMDGGGFRWDVQYYGTIGQGTNHAYGGGLYCQVDNANVQDTDRRGYVNDSGEEIEVGPYNRSGLTIHRRIKIYSDLPLARWLDIFENPTNRPITITVQIYSHINYGIQRMTTNSGGQSFGSQDWAFITEPRAGHNVPSLLHIVCGERSKFRPAVRIENNGIYARWRLSVPPNKAAILCYFESQNRSVEAHKKLMEKFRAFRLLRDLPASVRRMIVNFPRGFAFADIDIDRSERADKIVVKNGDPKYGEIVNESFNLGTLYGEITLPAEKIIGMVPVAEEPTRVRVLTTDGQVISGSASEAVVNMRMLSGGEMLRVPLTRIKQWSFRISESRPSEVEFSGPVAILRTGDRLTFDAEATKLMFHTRHGTVQLKSQELLEINMDNPANAVHRAVFINGSQLGGLLEPAEVALFLKIGPKLTLRRELIGKIVFAQEEDANPMMARIVLSNDDELFGELTDESFQIVTDFGSVSAERREIRTITFGPAELGGVAMRLWDGTVHRGQLQQEYVGFAIRPGPELKIPTGQIISIARSQALPPEETVRRIERLVAQLGAESYKDREAATEALIKLGPGILPLLREQLDNSDPEIRVRVEEIVERLSGEGGQAGHSQGSEPPGVPLIRRIPLL